MAEDVSILSEARERLQHASGLSDDQRRLVLLVMGELGERVGREVTERGGDPGYAMVHLSVLPEDMCAMLEWIYDDVRVAFAVEHRLSESSWHVVWRIPWRGDMDSVYGDLCEANVAKVVDEAVRRVTEVLCEKGVAVSV